MRNKTELSSILLLSGWLCFIFLAGCKSTRQISTAGSVRAKEAGEFFLSVQKQAFRYQTFAARTRMELNLPANEFSSRVDIKMVKDSAFQLSVLPLLGVEVFRIEFSTDSVKIIDRMNKRYLAESYAGLKGSTPIGFNFYNLQALFTNHIFVPGERNLSSRQYSRFTLRQDGAVTKAEIKDAMKLLYAFKADSEEKLLSTNVTEPSERYALQWSYTDFRPTDEQVFPMLMEAQLLDDGTPAGEIKLYFSRVQRDIPVNLDFSIPGKYKRITFAEIIKGLNRK
ncbi:MAG: DUF4292 domain-containing protein [Tannerellaceae bacterium]|nr:DUF4292 domain-containing protein [Tannerellaceae bacterium]